ncbi:tRNA pseudouridine(38-40) synthase TruA [Thermoactinomyces mirandus]|uniref:tRNA pseudouridine synthase A n=1 Tax=Thermoactinomyces mirandus TaxID=2756294 RepID=A0A7W2ASA0_9BACL|nr:tRNA pseudouridine(38-40) synthase TruA [Thermoactinomyces mirandus]MBA4603202.1 tRNA pseudouridine(38-40) synthase TruA [Thermoactinomyces mirandus]
MKKIKLTVAYDGTDFSGFQKQPGRRTVQGTLEEVLGRITGESVQIYGSGRTDAGVHALGQVCHFTTSGLIPVEKYPYILRRTLPRDLLVYAAEEVPHDFHAQKSAMWKTYRYQLDLQPLPGIFERRYRTHVPVSLDIGAMQEAANHLTGTHDFTSFCSAKTEVIDRVRTIFRCQVCQEAGGLVIEVTGNGFLYNMVRIIAGTLVEVGKKRVKPEEIPFIIQAKDRQKAGPTFPPEGLVLVQVGYHPWTDNYARES